MNMIVKTVVSPIERVSSSLGAPHAAAAAAAADEPQIDVADETKHTWLLFFSLYQLNWTVSFLFFSDYIVCIQFS